MLARQERGEDILRDMLRQMRKMKDDMEKATAEHTAAMAEVRSSHEFQALEEELRRAREESAQRP